MPEAFICREYRLTDGGVVTLIVYRPARAHDGPDFECSYAIRGLGTPVRQAITGVDEVQSMLLALRVAAAVLSASPEYKSRRLYWLEPDEPDLGLPLS
ncbi:DUF6968 family protein [Comamonas guangdongensis]|uniref:DUF6968 domain-containing protein n=1 Tax=Comamonas guangdongensis TaxID=510515 RepID=A0ABV4A0P6_9BURK